MTSATKRTPKSRSNEDAIWGATYQRIPLSKLFVDSRYQQDLSQRRVAKMAEEFDERKLGVLEVSHRKNDKYATFDGQHRLALLTAVGATEAPCLVHENLTPQEEAELFYEIQENRKRPTPVAAFRARRFAGEPVASAIGDILKNYDVQVGIGMQAEDRMMLAAVTAVERVWYAGNLDQTLSILVEAWASERKVFDKNLIEGMSYFLALYGVRVDRDKFLDVLEDETPTTVLRRAIAVQVTSGGAKRDLVTEELRKLARPAVTGLLRKPPKLERQVSIRNLTVVREAIAAGPPKGMAQVDISRVTGLNSNYVGSACRVLAAVGVLRSGGAKKVRSATGEGSPIWRLAPTVVEGDKAAA